MLAPDCQGHFDSVITRYRESLITAFPNPSTINALSYPSILKRIYDLLPQSTGSELARDLYYDKVLPERSSTTSPDPDQPFEQPLQTSTHALHLAPEGYILPHVDNVDASGTVIIGVSLGADRILRLEEATQDGRQMKIVHKGWDVLLKSGSLYLQKWVSRKTLNSGKSLVSEHASLTGTPSATTTLIPFCAMGTNPSGRTHSSCQDIV